MGNGMKRHCQYVRLNAENRLVEAHELHAPTNRAPYTVAYAYDHNGRMVSKRIYASAPSASPQLVKSTTYLWDGWNIIRETATDFELQTSNFELPSNSQTLTPSNSQTDYVWGLDLDGTLQGAGGVGGLLAVFRFNSSTPNSSTPQLYFPTYDANGNVSEYVSTNGEIVAHYDYSPFGEILVQSGPLADTFTHRFSTKPWCPVTGMYEYQMRKYKPEIGRWISRDPIGEKGGVNELIFCNNSPAHSIDKLGEKIKCCNGTSYDDNNQFCCEDTGTLFKYEDKGFWKGLASFSSFGLFIGFNTFQCDIKSNLTKLHKKHNLSVVALLGSVSIGSPVSGTMSKIEFGDFEPEDFGRLVIISSISGSLVGGASATVVRIGHAYTIDCGLQLGIDLSIGGAVGKTIVFDLHEIPCAKW